MSGMVSLRGIIWLGRGSDWLSTEMVLSNGEVSRVVILESEDRWTGFDWKNYRVLLNEELSVLSPVGDSIDVFFGENGGSIVLRVDRERSERDS